MTNKTEHFTPVNQKYVVRANRGKPRIWLEGKRLIDAGFECGDRFFAAELEGKLVLAKHPEGNRKVSGKNHRAIIDLSGSSCAPFQTGDAVSIWYTHDEIIICAEGK